MMMDERPIANEGENEGAAECRSNVCCVCFVPNSLEEVGLRFRVSGGEVDVYEVSEVEISPFAHVKGKQDKR